MWRLARVQNAASGAVKAEPSIIVPLIDPGERRAEGWEKSTRFRRHP